VPITEIPSKTSGSLGEALVDTRPAVANELSATHFEAMKDALITVTGEVGLSDGSTAGSLNERVAALEGAPSGGDVVGPASATDNAIARFDLATGKLIQNSGVTVGDVSGGAIAVQASATTDLSIRGGDGTGIAPGGDAILDGGANGGSGPGAVIVGGTHASAVQVGNSGALVTVPGGLTVGGTGLITTLQGLNRIRTTTNGISPNRYVELFDFSNEAGTLASANTFMSEVSPEGVVPANPGSLCFVRYPSANANDGVWQKMSGAGNTGWARLVGGPSSSTDNALARFDGTNGRVQSTAFATMDDSGNIAAGSYNGLAVYNDAPNISLYPAGAGGDISIGGTYPGGDVFIQGGVSDVGLTGNVSIQGGPDMGGGQGVINIGDNIGSAINIGRAGIVTTIEGSCITRAADRSVNSDVSISNATDEFIRVDTSGANRTLTLPDPATKGKFVIKKMTTDTNTISLARFAAENIEGTAATYLLPGSAGTGRPAWTVWSDGTDWWVIA
jgi:hypothetical protein